MPHHGVLQAIQTQCLKANLPHKSALLLLTPVVVIVGRSTSLYVKFKELGGTQGQDASTHLSNNESSVARA